VSMDNTQRKRSIQLGMSISTAVYQLQRRILFSFAGKLGLTLCFQCGREIETLAEFSIEHKEPWMDVSPDLYWDLNNIAFSHNCCNSSKARVTEARRRAGARNLTKIHKSLTAPVGMVRCAGHRDYLLSGEFNSNKRNVTGYASYCNNCRSERYKNGIST
jgi:hypothetical protein